MKYILYKTTNLINNYIYIGVHKTENPYIFDGYLGCGVYISQPSTYNKGKTYFQTAVNKYGPSNFRREVLSVYDTIEEANIAESLIVNEEFLSRNDVYNMVLGGYTSSITAIKCFQYSLEGDFIAEFSSTREASFSIKKTQGAVWAAITFKTKCGGYYWSLEKFDKLNISIYNQSPEAIKVYRYLYTGEFDSEFESLTQAAKDSSVTLIQVARSARLGYRVGIYQYSFIKADSYDKAKSIYLKTRPVFKYDINGNFLAEYETQKDAEWDNPNSNITKSIKNKKPCINKFIWSLEKLPKFCSTKTVKKAVGMFSTNGDLLKSWESIKSWNLEYKLSPMYIREQKLYKKENVIFKFI